MAKSILAKVLSLFKKDEKVEENVKVVKEEYDFSAVEERNRLNKERVERERRHANKTTLYNYDIK